MRTTSCCLGIVLLVALLSGTADAATYRIESGDRLTVQTAHLEACFQGPDMIYLKNLLTSEVYTGNSAPLNEMGRIKVQNSSDKRFATGNWTLDKKAWTAEYAGHDQTASYNMQVCAADGELVIKCDGASQSGGVYAITWGAGNLSLSSTSAVLPAKAGRILTKETTTASEGFEYPQNWEAQFAIVQGKKGSACIYTADQEMRFKRLDTARQKDLYQLVFQTDNQAPFAQQKTVQSVEWRVDCLKGDWRSAVDLYKQHVEKAGLLVQSEAAANQKWPTQIRGHVRISGDFNNVALLDELATRVIPQKTLIYLPDWRRDGYDVNYPDYTSKPGVREFVSHAQKLGFKVMLHVDLPGVTPTHPAYDQVKQYHLKDSMSLQPMGWLWDKDVPQKFAFIDPASSKFREIFVDAMRGVVRDYNPDAVHLDVSGPMWNDGNGLIEGMNYCQGSVRLHQELLKALPDLVLVGESINEILAPYQHFAQRWAWDCSLDPHPVCDYLFDGLTQSYGYLGQPNPDDSPAGFLQYVKPYESQGVVPTMAVNSIGDLDKPGAVRWFNVMRAWQEHDLSPDWSSAWPNSVLFRLKGDDGTQAVVERTGSGVHMLCDGKVLYERLEGVSGANIQGHIANHYAYNGDDIFGLDPAHSYWVDRGKPDSIQPHVTSLHGDILVKGARLSDDLVAFELAPGNKNVIMDMWESISAAGIGTISQGKRGPVERGATFYAINGTVNGIAKRGIVAHPPWQPRQDSNSGSLGQTYAIYSMSLPKQPAGNCRFEASLGINDEARDSDGVTFIVTLNDKEALRKHITKEMQWQDVRVDLSQYAGKEVDIELITDPGPDNNTNWDQGVWGTPRVVSNNAVEHCSASIDIMKRPLWSVPGSVSLASQRNYPAQVTTSYKDSSTSEQRDILLPAAIYFAYREPDVIGPPCDLTKVGYNAGLSIDGCYRVGSVWGGGKPETVKTDGVERDAINAHPPSKGCTVLTWLLQLPDNKKQLLEFTAGVKPNASTGGVGFSVRVNGQILWDKTFTRSDWQNGSVNISRYAGQRIVLELVTDSMGEEFCDWASWVEPRITGITN